MKKPIALRILLLLLLYAGVFTLVVLIQFNKQGGFTQRIGNFIVTGQYREPLEGEPAPESGEYLLTGKASLFFGGMEFCLGSAAEDSVLVSVDAEGKAEEILPLSMLVSEEAVLFRLSGGAELSFVTQYSGGVAELGVSSAFPGGEEEGAVEFPYIELPYRPMRKVRINNSEDSELIVSSDGVSYTFGSSPMDISRRLLIVRAGESSVSYRAVPDDKTFDPADFILPGAGSGREYAEAVTRWVDGNYSRWSRTVTEQNDEDLVIALAAESINRGTYRAAVSSVPQVFLGGNRRTYRSSVYLGRLDQAYRSLSAAEREKLSSLSRTINEGSLDFFNEPHVLEFFAIRGYGAFLDDGAELIRSIGPEDISLALCPGILEAHADWKNFRPLEENPFERLIDQVRFVISGALYLVNTGTQSGAKVYACYENKADIEFNIRLGRALLAWAQDAGEESWAGLARSLVFSSLPRGAEPSRAVLSITEEGGITEDPSAPFLSPARVFRLLRTGPNYPKAMSLGDVNGSWTWTAASGVSVSQENNIIDIAVSFPAGETHYMIIKGIRAFQKIQLYGMDFRTDPQFERYDSSGWSYVAAEQTLLVKMKHRAAIEHIRIYY